MIAAGLEDENEGQVAVGTWGKVVADGSRGPMKVKFEGYKLAIRVESSEYKFIRPLVVFKKGFEVLANNAFPTESGMTVAVGMRGRIVKQPVNDKRRMTILFESSDMLTNDHYGSGSEHSVVREQFHCLQLLNDDDMPSFMCVAEDKVIYRFSRCLDDRHPEGRGVSKDVVVKGIPTKDGWIHTNTEFWLPIKQAGNVLFATRTEAPKSKDKSKSVPFWTFLFRPNKKKIKL